MPLSTLKGYTRTLPKKNRCCGVTTTATSSATTTAKWMTLALFCCILLLQGSIVAAAEKDTNNLRSSSNHEQQPQQQQQKQQQTQKKKPIAVINVGPRKTGTTAIQSSLHKYIKEFEEDDFVVIDKNFHEIAPCLAFKKPDTTWTTCDKHDYATWLQDYTTRALEANQNIIYSSEVLDRVKDIDLPKLKQLFEGFEIHVFCTYRRFFEWTVSFYGQLYRHGIGWMDWDTVPEGTKSSLVDYFTLDRLEDLDRIHYTPNVVDFYSSAGIPTHIINFHAQEDIVNEFFCLDEVQAPTVCEATKAAAKKEADETHSNKGSSIEFDRIAMAAVQEGLLDPSTILRPDARAAIETYFEDTLGLKETELPKTCLPPPVVQMLRDYSLTVEEQLLPDYFASPEGSHALLESFDHYRYSFFCTVNTTQILASPELQTFLQNLEDSSLS